MAPVAAPIRLDLVIATWCPHCVPESVARAPRLAKQLGVPLRILDIDVPAQEREADRLVARFGDWTPDYLVPQLFLARADGSIEHLLTGVPGDPAEGTRKAWDRVLERFGARGGRSA